MLLRLLMLVLTFSIPLSAIQENAKVASSAEITAKSTCCNDCNSCREKPSAFELLQIVQGILNNRTLLLPQLQPLLVQQLKQIVTQGGIGIVGPPGPTGATGAQGPAGGVLDFADFFALMPPDNAATVGVGTDVSFPQNGPSSGTGLIARLNATQFNLADIGVYQVLFQVSVTEAGQLILTLNGADLAYTVVGRATGTSQIIGMALVSTSSINSILTVRNPAGNSTALTITPLAGGTRSVSAHLVITRIK